MRAHYMASVLLSLSAGVPCIPADKQHSERQPTEGGERSHGRESFTSSGKKQEPCPRVSLCPRSWSRRRGSPCRRRRKQGPCPRASPCPRSRSLRHELLCPPA